MHDITDFARRGLPAVYIATEEFVTAGQAQADALGAEMAAVFVPHPIQDRSDDEIRALAEGAVEQVVAALVGYAALVG